MITINIPGAPVRPCIKCGACDRSSKGNCNACARARANAWHASNSERSKSSKAAHYAANSERIRAKNAAWLAANQEKTKANRAAWAMANKDRSKATTAAWRLSHPEQVKAQISAWNEANPEARRIHHQNRRAKKRSGGGVLSKGLAEKLFKLQKGMCPCCKQPLGDSYHLDHKMPLALGGSNTDDNMQLLRAVCNLQKKAKHPVDFMQQRGFLL